MKAKLFAFAVSSLLLLTPTLRAGDTNTIPPAAKPHGDAPRVSFFLIPPQIFEKLNLTEDQKTKLKSIDETFGKTQQEYIAAHKDEIDAARKAMETAMAGLQEQRKAAMEQVKSLLTQEQVDMIQSKKGTVRGAERGAVKPPPE